MTDFDNLIKEKAEQAEYKYSASAWKRFASRAGFKVGLSGLQIAVVTIASVAVVGGAIFFTTHSKNASSPAIEQPSAKVVTVVDSVAAEQELIAEKSPQAVENKTVARTKKQTVVAESFPTETEPVVEEKSAKPSHIRSKKQYGRPVRINVDTITDNVPTDEQLKKGNSRL